MTQHIRFNYLDVLLLHRPSPLLDPDEVAEAIHQCVQRRISPMAWSPLAGGRLVDGQGEAEMRVQAVLSKLRRKYGADLDQLIYAWLLRHPSRIIPVLGTNRIERITSAARALSLQLELQDWFAVWTASSGAEVP